MSDHSPSCPSCGTQTGWKDYCPASFLPGDARVILECPSCGLGILWPLPTPGELSAYYSQGYYDFNRSREEGKGLYFAERLKRLSPTGRFLDIGCATGFLLSGIQKHCGWELYGLETGVEAAAYARTRLGIEVRDVPLESAGYPPDFFDVLHLNNVLEHTLDPAAVLGEAHHILKPGGRLFVSVPNGHIDRLGYRKVLERTGQRGASKDGHLYFFTGEALERLAAGSGLRVTRARSSGFKRALKVLGWWPEKRGWERDYQGRPRAQRTVEASVVEGTPHGARYYLWKHTQEELFQYPGYSRYTYDYNLVMTKPLKASPSE